MDGRPHLALRKPQLLCGPALHMCGQGTCTFLSLRASFETSRFCVVGLCFHLWFRFAPLLYPWAALVLRTGSLASGSSHLRLGVTITVTGAREYPWTVGSGLPVPAGAGWAREIKPQPCFSLQRSKTTSKTKQTGPEVPSPLLTDCFVCVSTQQAFRQHTREAVCHSVNYFVHSLLLSVSQSVPLTNMSFHDAKGVHCHLGTVGCRPVRG